MSSSPKLKVDRKLTLRIGPNIYECPYCLKPVGVLGNWLAKLFGTGFHGCTFSNVTPPPIKTVQEEEETFWQKGL